VPAHSHDAYAETIYGLDGVLTWTVDGTPTDIGPRDALYIPRGVVHHFDNAGDVDASALAIVTPGILSATTSASWERSSNPPQAGRPT
jgi:quercetin dioxygenase-like cupin family protein